jgi:hypothetical protein
VKLPGNQSDCVGFTPAPRRLRGRAFTLLEVMIAVFVFFVSIFAILELVSQSLGMARSLSKNEPHAGILAAELALTNKLEEGSATGDFGDLFPNYSWTRNVTLYSTGGMFQVYFEVFKPGMSEPFSKQSVFLWRPESVAGAGSSLSTRTGVSAAPAKRLNAYP